TLSPGSVSQLARSNVPVFRVSFDSEIPAPEKRYFRGIVFQEFDGRSWRASATPPGIKGTVKVRGNLTYRIHFETRQVDRLFPMDLPLKLPAGTVLRGDFTAKAPKEGIKDSPYTFRSSLAYNTGEMQPWEVIFLHLPEGGNPRSRALAMEWRRTLITPEKIIETALNRFRNTDFRYTLSPPPLKGDPVDAFLFKTQKGYCEHFASSFTYLMRAAGIPARVVGGYLGGSVNPFGEYLIVRQSDAHAWCEVWLKGKGWTRIDPTSVVAPARLEQGAGFALPEVERPSFFITGSSSLFSRTLHRIRLGWDSINYQWDAKVIGYSFSLQTTFLKKLGITTTGWKGLLKAAFWVFGLLGIILAAGWLLMEFKGREKHSHVQTSWLIFQSKMAKSGLAKEKSQGPLDFLAAIQKKRPALASDAARITQLYVQLAYGKRAGDQKVEKRLRKKVRRFKVHRPAKKPI
ncbi:MAG: DUF3488 and transglutaminase-like domain-containing protein, partial [Desulfobacterales bacterium]|nr:DUF3488 and transglutaminase-like domain-containing protein [Desulfobacterales bacterium]